jgi:hypothetical protein
MHLDVTLSFSQFIGSLPIFVTVILAWMQTNGRISGLKEDLARRMDDTRDLLRAEFRRVEEVMDARLKHLEERER